MSKKNIIVIDESVPSEAHNPAKGYITFPFTEDNFADFLSSLLGQQQEIFKVMAGNFEIHLSDLQNFHFLLNQRVAQQNNGTLILFTSQIGYSDNSLVTLNSFDELTTYNEIKPVIPVYVRMSWTFLITFQDKKVPEKQEIEIIIRNIEEEELINKFSFPLKPTSNGSIEIKIKHTARTWGGDIENLLSNHISNLLTKESKIKKWLHNRAFSLSATIAMLLSTVSFAFLKLKSKTEISDNVKLLNDFNKLQKNVIDKIEYLMNYIVSDSYQMSLSTSLLNICLILFTTIISGFIVHSLLTLKKPSYIILNREALKYKERMDNQYFRVIILDIISLLVAVSINVGSSFLYELIKSIRLHFIFL